MAGLVAPARFLRIDFGPVAGTDVFGVGEGAGADAGRSDCELESCGERSELMSII